MVNKSKRQNVTSRGLQTSRRGQNLSRRKVVLKGQDGISIWGPSCCMAGKRTGRTKLQHGDSQPRQCGAAPCSGQQDHLKKVSLGYSAETQAQCHT